MSADLLRRAADAMRDEYPPTWWQPLAAWLDMAADHVAGRGDPCGSCVQQALVVARAYLQEQP